MKAYVAANPARMCIIMDGGARKLFRNATTPHTVAEAEYLAVLQAVRLGATEVCLSSTSVVKQLKGERKVSKPGLLCLWGEVMKAAGDGNIIVKSEKVQFTWVSKSENPTGKALNA